MKLVSKVLPLAFCLFLTGSAQSQQTFGINKIAQIDLKEYADTFRLFSGSDEDHGRRAKLFTLAVTPEGDFVALIAMQSGPWHLVRIKDWVTGKAKVERLDMPGYGSNEDSGKFSIEPQILVTSNGNYLIVIAPEPWPWDVTRQNEAIISVVDLHTFQVVITQRSSEQGLNGDWSLVQDGSLRVTGVNRIGTKPAGSEQWLALVSLPDLKSIDRCDFSVEFNPPNSNPMLRAELHGTASSSCTREAQNYVAHHNDPTKMLELDGRLQPDCPIESINIDGSTAIGTCRDCHQTLFGVTCKSERTEVYAIANGKTIAKLPHAAHKLTRALVVQSREKLYLLSLEDASKLTIYEIPNTSQP